MSGTLVLTRTTIGVDVRRGTYEVFIDGARVGSYELHETYETQVASGRHSLQIRGGRYSSQKRSFEVSDGQTVRFNCSGKRFLPLWLASFAIPSLGLKIHRR